MINLGDYFKGSLLRYSVCITNRSEAESKGVCATNSSVME
jgi:hypothetical protein